MAQLGRVSAGLSNIIIIISFCAFTNTYATTFAFDHLIHTIVFAFTLAGLSLVVLSKLYPSFYENPRTGSKSTSFPFQDLNLPRSSRGASPVPPERNATLYADHFLWTTAWTTIALLFRVELLRRTLNGIECARPGIECIVPAVLGLWDYFCHRQKRNAALSPNNATILTRLKKYALYGSLRYVYVSFCFSLGSYVAVQALSSLDTTYICPSSLPSSGRIPLYQWLGALADCYILISAEQLLRPGIGANPRQATRGPNAWASVLFISAAFWVLFGAIGYYLDTEWSSSLFSFEREYLWSAIWQSMWFALLIASSSRSLSTMGVTKISHRFVGIFVFVYFVSDMLFRAPFPPKSSSEMTLVLTLFFLGFEMSDWDERRFVPLATQKAAKLRSIIDLILLGLFLGAIFLEVLRSDVVRSHPIDDLIFDANVRHSHWVRQAAESRSLEEAVLRYKQRYHTFPPPGFDKWYEYATRKSSIIIDNYDQIYRDLLPFWSGSISPAEIREKTWEMVSNPWNEISGISVRDGRAMLQENVLPTHRWMLEGVAKMINQFAEYLPDMDLAFNLNDECRVAVPWVNARFYEGSSLRNLRLAADQVATAVENKIPTTWSDRREEDWKIINKTTRVSTTAFENHSFRPSFYKYGVASCPPTASVNRRLWDPRIFCVDCTQSHSAGQFISNWTFAADPCHQPDLANLHGFYLSPAAFKTSRTLMPVFSQSKVHGYYDILYPSAWNYMDKVKYSPSKEYPDRPYAEKDNTLFWRGATSEGVSADGTWKGMVRQRLVHLTNDLINPQKQHKRHTLLLPHPSHDGEFQYRNLHAASLATLGLNTSIHIVDTIVRSGGSHDGPDQAQELAPLVKPSDFQHHWNYRYLFDLDGAGFSGRFLPFLQSHSLPFKSALFREWYDDRITPWLHFVPQDLRLHAVWSTLAYFAGVDGKSSSRTVRMTPHVKEGAMIAEKGREWAGKALRKEDMEIYFFRLLLEWGRLTDDHRDEIGYAG